MATDTYVTVGQYSIEPLTVIGRGLFGIFVNGMHIKNKKPVVAKILNYKTKEAKTKNETLFKIAQNEIDCFKGLSSHPNIAQLMYSHDDGEQFWLILEYCNLGDLMKYMKSKKPDITARLKIMTECASAISFMHSLKMVHRDIKPQTIFMKRENKEDVVKIADFGLGGNVGEKDVVTMVDQGDSVFYMAPECFDADETDSKYQPAVDTFSLGLLFWVVLCYDGKDPHLRPVSGIAIIFKNVIIIIIKIQSNFQKIYI